MSRRRGHRWCGLLRYRGSFRVWSFSSPLIGALQLKPDANPPMQLLNNFASQLTQRLERRPNLLGEELRLLPCPEMTALTDLMEIRSFALRPFGPALGRTMDHAGE